MSGNTNSEHAGVVKTLRPYHVWALGVGIVLVGEYMGWNFTVAKGGILGSLFALLVAGTMFVMVSLCASELGSSTKLAGGPYDWARLFVGPVQLHLWVLQYTWNSLPWNLLTLLSLHPSQARSSRRYKHSRLHC